MIRNPLVTGPSGDHRLGLQRRAGILGRRGEPARVGGTGHEALEIAHAVAGMVTVAGDSTGLGFAFDDKDLAVDLQGQRGGGGQS